MSESLQNTVLEPSCTKAAIRQALMSPAGLRTVWVVVEAEDDWAVYVKFMRPDTTVVKTSKGENGRKSYKNVELIVREIKQEVPVSHIMGIRDTDYTRYEVGYNAPENIFLTDHRDLEMMMLDSDSVNQSLRTWAPTFDAAWAKCVPVCRHFGYLRIFNSLNGYFVVFHDNLKPVTYWNDNNHDLKPNWEQESTSKFMSLAVKDCCAEDFTEFVSTLSLDKEDFLDICRGHDLIPVISKALIRNHIYSVDNIMVKMTEAYTLEDFKKTRLYASIQAWQATEGVTALVE